MSREVKEMFSDTAKAVVDTLTQSAKDTINAFIEDSLDSSGIIDWDQLNDSAKDSIRQIISDSLSAHDALRLLNDSLYYFAYPKSTDDNPIYYWWSSSEGYIYILVDSLGNGVDGDPEAIGMIKVDSLGDGSLHQLVNTKSLLLDSTTTYYLSPLVTRDNNEDWTIEYWVYVDTSYVLSEAQCVHFAGSSATGYNTRIICPNSGPFRGPMFVPNEAPVGGNVFGDSSAALNFNRWVHVTVTHDASDSLKIYQGGIGVPDTLAGFHDLGGYNLIVMFMSGVASGASALKGYLDDLRIWSKTKTLAEVNTDRDQELNGDETNLMYYWTFNDKITCDRTDSTKTWIKNAGNISYSAEIPFE